MSDTAQRLAPDTLAQVFGDDLPRMPASRAFASLCERGARATVESRYGARR